MEAILDHGFGASMGTAEVSRGENMDPKIWTYKLIFSNISDELDTVTCETFSAEEFKNEFMKKHVKNSKEKIIKVYNTRTPLVNWDLFGLAMKHWFHSYLVFNTETCWWSIEKLSNIILMQRGPTKESVQLYQNYSFGQGAKAFKKEGRPIKMEEQQVMDGIKTIKDCVDVIIQDEELDRPYGLGGSNCQQFSGDLFGFLTGFKFTEKFWFQNTGKYGPHGMIPAEQT